MKKIILSLLLVILLTFSGCVSESEKTAVREGFKKYFDYLSSCDYASANALTFDPDPDDGIISDINSCAVNDMIFKKVSYEIWSISKKDGVIYVDTVIEQVSLVSAYASTAEEFAQYKEIGESTGKEYSESALENKFDEMLFNNLNSEEVFSTYRCTVPCYIENGVLYIGMTDRFRNALFGGELDAIKSMKN